MSKFKFYFIALFGALALFSCNKSDDDFTYEPLRFYAVQYQTDIKVIENYLKGHYIEQLVDHPGFSDDQDVTISKIPAGNTTLQSLWDSPYLFSKDVVFNNYTYKVYYLKFREGDATSGVAPCRVDEILAGYDGYYLTDGTATTEDPYPVTDTRFEYSPNASAYMRLDNLIEGWGKVFPLFKSGVPEPGQGPNPTVYNNFGAGVMFLPSALAYYNVAQGTIPKYSCLVFHFKLYDVKRADQDGDGILSIDEDLNQDGNFTNDDTDGDGTQNYLDADDDGDGYLTRQEIKHVINGTNYYYPYNGAAVDDPATEVDERQGIPRKFTGPSELKPGSQSVYWNVPATDNSDFTEPSRLRRHLDNTAMPPYYDNQQ